MEYISFMAGIQHKEIDYVEETLQEYAIGQYIIGMEKSTSAHKELDGEHMHFCVQMTQDDYHRYSKRVFIDRFKLRGRAQKDKPRQYGKVKSIDNIDKMLSYTTKDGHFRTNMSSEEIKKIYEASYQKKDWQDEETKLFTYLSKQNLEDMLIVDRYGNENYNCLAMNNNYDILNQSIIRYYIENDLKISLSRSMIENKSRKYLMYYYNGNENNKIDFKTNWLYNIMFNK